MNYVKIGDLEKTYQKCININNIKDILPQKAIDISGSLIDVSYYLKKEDGLRKALVFLETISNNESLKDEGKGVVYYFFGNAYSDLDSIQTKSKNSFEWINENKEKAIYYYRKALTKKLDKSRISQILINLANHYDYFGRFVKSIDLYEQSISDNTTNYEKFMGYGNKGIALLYYSYILYDKGHKTYFQFFAYQNLKKALSLNNINTKERKRFKGYYDALKQTEINKIKEYELKLNNFSLGESEEKDYRKWCLINKLFLNPLNDLGNYNIAANDVFHLPNMTLKISQNHIEFPSFYNQLKQEYVSARYLFYDGMKNIEKNHFSDKDVLLINPLDYPRYSLNIEKIKASFKMLYSLFDKISLFIRLYLNLKSKNDYNQDFRKIWYDNSNKRELNQEIKLTNNRAFRGLFLISKDLLFHHPDRNQEEITVNELKESLEPSAKEINLLRNNLEHGYVKIHEDFYNIKNNQMFKDKLSYSISESDLKEYTLKLLNLSREALINLSLGVHIEELEKAKNLKDKIIPKIQSDIYEDNWKY